MNKITKENLDKDDQPMSWKQTVGFIGVLVVLGALAVIASWSTYA